MKTLFALMVLSILVLSPNARAQGPDDQYVSIYNVIQEGDSLTAKGQSGPAMAKYAGAQTDLQHFQKNYPDWNPKVVDYRLRYLAAKIGQLSSQPPPAGAATNAPANPPNASPTNAPTVVPSNTPATNATNSTGPESTEPPKPSPPPPETENQIKALRDQIKGMEADNALLQAKLKEALAAQPAAVDPREFAKAQDTIRNLQKQNELLQASLEEKKSKLIPAPAPAADTVQAKQALAEARRQIESLNESNAALAAEKDVLQGRVKTLSAPDVSLAALHDENEILKKQVAELQAKASAATAEADLEQKLKAAQAQVAVLQSEKEIQHLEEETLQGKVKQLTDAAKAAPVAPVAPVPPPQPSTTAAVRADLEQKLKAAQAQVTALQSEKETLRLEEEALQGKVKQMTDAAKAATTVAPVAITPPAQSNSDATSGTTLDSVTSRKIAALEAQRDELQKSLEAATKDIYGRKKGKAASAHIEEMSREIGALHARIDILEAQPTPYTPEELALLSKPDVTLSASVHKTGRKTPKELPPAAAVLLSEARRYFVAHEWHKAEAKYIEVLKFDEKNVATLADLASIQMQLGRNEDAEKNIQVALGVDPKDDYALFILGQLKFGQKKYDEAFDALSQAAQINPQNAKIQNFLGLALSEKGLPIQAASAFRKAIQYEPGFAEAHLNLAVVYASAQPPMVELARWEYQKALSIGHAPNPGLEAMLDPSKGASTAAH